MSEDDDAKRQARFAAGGALSSAARRIDRTRSELIFGNLADFDMVRGQIAQAEHDLLAAKAYLAAPTYALDRASMMYGPKLEVTVEQ